MDTLFQNYDALIGRVNAQCEKIETALSEHMVCRKGCASCCLNISLFPVEALRLRMALDALGAEVRASVLASAVRSLDEGPCPLVDTDGACRLYGARPVICRTHGLPILFADEEGARRVDFCPENFKGVASLSGDAMIDLDALNQILTGVNAQFCEALFGGAPPFERISISEALKLELDA